MKDILNHELQIGDIVVYIQGKNSNANLAIGHITKFYTGQSNKNECSVDGHTHITENRILKL